MRNNAEKAKATCSSFEMLRIGDCALFTIRIYVFNSADLVTEGLVLTACTVTDGRIGASNGDSIVVILA